MKDRGNKPSITGHLQYFKDNPTKASDAIIKTIPDLVFNSDITDLKELLRNPTLYENFDIKKEELDGLIFHRKRNIPYSLDDFKKNIQLARELSESESESDDTVILSKNDNEYLDDLQCTEEFEPEIEMPLGRTRSFSVQNIHDLKNSIETKESPIR